MATEMRINEEISDNMKDLSARRAQSNLNTRVCSERQHVLVNHKTQSQVAN